MIDWILLTIGSLFLLYAQFYYIRDCRGHVSSSMGGEMSFGVYWSIGAVLFSFGLLPIAGYSRWWSIAGYLVGMVIFVPVRAAISRIFCVPCVPEPTGFQKFIRKTEKKMPKN